MADLNPDARVVAHEVEEIVDTDLEEGSINAHINFAHTLTDRVTGLSATELGQIELLLAAHFVSIQQPQLKSESVGGSFSASYQVGPLDEGLKATVYGQQAIALDDSGTLANLGKHKALLKVYRSDT